MIPKINKKSISNLPRSPSTRTPGHTPYISLIRLPNIIIVTLTQFLIQYRIIIPALKSKDLTPLLSDISFALLVLATILVAAAGNVINDIFDVEIDKINKPDKQIVSKQISIKSATTFYYVLIGTGLLLSSWIAYETDRFSLLFIFPLAIIGLHTYSKSLKAKGLIGNIIVSLFVAFVTGILLIAELNQLLDKQVMIQGIPVLDLLLGYITFSFLANLIRELVKDMEDIEGDEKLGYRSFPIVHGMKKSKLVITIFIGFLFLALASWLSIYDYYWIYLLIFGIGIFIIILFAIWKAQSVKSLHNVSSLLKLAMVFGLGYLLLF